MKSSEPRQSPWRAVAFELPASVPTMLSREERQYLYWLGRSQWSDEGHVLDIGPWLGGSTFCLAAGMRAARPAARHRLVAVDNFRWREFMASAHALPLAPGESFEPAFRANVAPFRDLIEVQARSLPDEPIPGDEDAARKRGPSDEGVPPFRWDAAQRIEVLFVDGAKSWRALRALFLEARSALAAGRSLLVFQDFKHWGAYWVPMVAARLASCLELAHDVREGSTCAFRLRAEIPREALEALEDGAPRVPTARGLDDLERAAAQLGREGNEAGAWPVRLGAVRFLAHQQRLEEARATYEDLLARWPEEVSDGPLERARTYLEGRMKARLRSRRGGGVASSWKERARRFLRLP